MGMGAFLFQTNAITIGTVYLILHYLGIINGPLNRIGSQFEDLQRIRVSVERVKTLTETRPKIKQAYQPALLPSGRGACVYPAARFSAAPPPAASSASRSCSSSMTSPAPWMWRRSNSYGHGSSGAGERGRKGAGGIITPLLPCPLHSYRSCRLPPPAGSAPGRPYHRSQGWTH